MSATTLRVYDWLAARPVVAGLMVPGATTVVYYLYRSILPKPIPGIPYNKDVGLLGDLPEMLGHIAKTKTLWNWMAGQNSKHKSPVAQVFITPFSSAPTIILSDAREIQDILLRRADEFDRDWDRGWVLRGILPTGQFTLETGDEWRAHRALTKDLMTPAFLHTVSAPAIYERAWDLMQLWAKKAELARGLPFGVKEDISYCALDAIFDSAFGTDDGLEILRGGLKFLNTLGEAAATVQNDGTVKFAELPVPEAAKAIIALDDSVEQTIQSATPKYVWKRLAWTPWWAKAWRIKEDLTKKLVEKSRDRIERKTTHEYELRCAIDNMVARELNMAKKSGRQPEFHSRGFYDEVFGYIEGGFGTTSTTTQWAVKFMSDQGAAQTKFRETMYTHLQAARAERRVPTVKEIIDMRSPYVDAFLEELIRHAITLPGTTRVATRDTTVLGHPVPKGVELFLLGNGPDFFTPGFDVPESSRSRSSRDALSEGKAPGSWDRADMGAFRPERWLVADENGRQVFDRNAGLQMSFGLGMRGCFGRRLAELEFRIFICLFAWSFVFEPLEEELATHTYVDKLTRVPTKCFVRLTPIA